MARIDDSPSSFLRRSAANVKRAAKMAVKRSLHAAGLEISRRSRNGEDGSSGSVPLLLDTSYEAAYELQGGGRAAFRCPIDSMVIKNGFAFGPGKWNPFEATMREFQQGRTTYASSVLKRFYDTWSPRNALEALLFTSETSILSDQPSYTLHTPFTSMTIDESKAWRKTYYRREMAMVLGHELHISEGFKYHGPVSERVGEAEYGRCAGVYRSLREKGYDRRHGDVGVVVLRRGDEERFLLAPGHHRVAAMAALGMTWVPAFIRHGGVFDLRDIRYWPQVRRGVWEPDLAEAYFHHLFDFDSHGWAADRGLLVGPPAA